MSKPDVQSVALKSLLDDCIALSRPTTRLSPSEVWFTASKEFRVSANPKRLQTILVKLLNHGVHAPQHRDIKVWISRSPYLANGVRVGFRGALPWPSVDQVLDQPGDSDWVHLEYESENTLQPGTLQPGTLQSGTPQPGSAQRSGTQNASTVEPPNYHVLWMDLSLCNEQAELINAAGPDTNSGEREYFHILYIEDNSANLSLVETALTHREHVKLLKASTGEEGIEIAAQQQPNLILLDINLPGIDGYEALYQLANTDSTWHIPVIAVSANAMGHDVERARKAGARDYLVKPYSINKLFELIDQWSAFGDRSTKSSVNA